MAFGVLVSDACVALRRWLEESGVAPGARLPSAAMLSSQMKLGYYPLNRAIDRLISAGMIRREGYKLYRGSQAPSAAAAPFSVHLVIYPDADALRSYAKVAKEMGVSLQIHRWECTEEAVAILHGLDTPKTESVLFEPPFSAPASLWEPAVAALNAHGIPVIAVGQYSRKTPCIIADDTRSLELAIGHLAELGHTELALATMPPLAPASVDLLTAWRRLCPEKGFSSSRERVFFQSNRKALREDAQDLVSKLTNAWGDVTGLIVYSDLEPTYLLEEFSHRHRRVPDDTSIVFLGGMRQRRPSILPLTMAVFDSLLIQETAFRMAQGAALAMKRNFARKPWCLRFDPNLILADPKLPPSSFVTPSKPGPVRAVAAPAKPTATEASADLARELDRMLNTPYALAADAKPARFASVDLGAHVNRPLNYRRGWLGDKPLKHFPSGQRRIHGVPFQVLGGTRQTSYGAVVFRSTINTEGKKRELPARLSVPIGAKVLAVYILHGCGYTRPMHQFATYTFYGAHRELGTVPLVSLGQTPSDFDPKKNAPDIAGANIQDWWADYLHIDFPGARRAPVVDLNDPKTMHRHVCLYTLEWVNPFPETKVTRMEISVNPNQSTTLGLLAISVLKK